MNRTESLVPAIDALQEAGIKVSLFIDPDLRVISRCKALAVDAVELHTGPYANETGEAQALELDRLKQAAKLCVKLGLGAHAGHGLTLQNLAPVAAIEELAELNIGHALMGDALFMGLNPAVKAYQEAIATARR